MRFRGRSIRRKIVALLMVPLLALISIWSFATLHTGAEAKQLVDTGQVLEEISRPVEQTVQAVQQERRHALVYLADPRRSDALPALRREQINTDQAGERLSAVAQKVRGRLDEGPRKRLDALLDGVRDLEALRTKVARNTVSRENAYVGYNTVTDPSHELLGELHAIDHATLDKEARALVGVLRARELLSREDALMAAALAAGRMTEREFRDFGDRVAERKLTYQASFEALPESEARVYQEYWEGPNGKTLTSFETEAFAAGADGVVTALNAERWDSATAAVLTDLEELDHAAAERHADRVEPVALSILVQAGIAGVLGLVAVLVSIFVSVRIGRGLVRDLRALRNEAQESAGVRLPSVQRRLAAGEVVDVETESPQLEYGRDEIGQVGQALSTLQRAAVEGAVKQADMRRGVSEVFVNLARRSQVLLHRQLTLLDTMERRTEDADELADLFRLDHLTTRMRRHAEGLVILSGAAPSRQWRKPVQLMDVVRAAVAEVEDYERVEVRRLARLAVDGPAVADVTHLIAELLENATVFSPPHTAVQVQGERVANGFTLEIHDRGLGMTPDALLEANLRLAETPEFELSDTDRLGLFVVSRLAQRQGVRVSLQPSPYGGTTAVVLIPGAILNESNEPATEALESAENAVSATGRTPALAQRLALAGHEGEGEATAPGAGRPADRTSPQPEVRAFRPPSPPVPRWGRPVELEAVLEELDGPVEGDGDSIGRLFRGLAEGEGRGQPGDQHQQASDESAPDGGPRPAHDDGPIPLPRRRPGTHGGPVLVSDHGRPVGNHRPRRAEAPAPENDRAAPAQTVDGLPRRVRQASLAPQLKTPGQSLPGGDRETDRAPAGTPADDERDPDEVRSRMASLQRGWQRGRRHNDGTTPEGNGR